MVGKEGRIKMKLLAVIALIAVLYLMFSCGAQIAMFEQGLDHMILDNDNGDMNNGSSDNLNIASGSCYSHYVGVVSDGWTCDGCLYRCVPGTWVPK